MRPRPWRRSFLRGCKCGKNSHRASFRGFLADGSTSPPHPRARPPGGHVQQGGVGGAAEVDLSLKTEVALVSESPARARVPKELLGALVVVPLQAFAAVKVRVPAPFLWT